VKKLPILLCSLLVAIISPSASAALADDVTVTVTAQSAGPTPFIAQLTLLASDTASLRSIQFTVAPKPGSVTRALSGTGIIWTVAGTFRTRQARYSFRFTGFMPDTPTPPPLNTFLRTALQKRMS
jgi:hypothetical protein